MAAALTAVAVAAGCGDDGGDSPPTRADRPPSKLTVRVAELQGSIAAYCENFSSRSPSAGEEARARADVKALIGLARRAPDRKLDAEPSRTVRDALADVAIVLRTDCARSPLRRRVDRALAALP